MRVAEALDEPAGGHSLNVTPRSRKTKREKWIKSTNPLPLRLFVLFVGFPSAFGASCSVVFQLFDSLLLGFTGFYRVWLGLIGFNWAFVEIALWFVWVMANGSIVVEWRPARSSEGHSNLQRRRRRRRRERRRPCRRGDERRRISAENGTRLPRRFASRPTSRRRRWENFDDAEWNLALEGPSTDESIQLASRCLEGRRRASGVRRPLGCGSGAVSLRFRCGFGRRWASFHITWSGLVFLIGFPLVFSMVWLDFTWFLLGFTGFSSSSVGFNWLGFVFAMLYLVAVLDFDGFSVESLLFFQILLGFTGFLPTMLYLVGLLAFTWFW